MFANAFRWLAANVGGAALTAIGAQVSTALHNPTGGFAATLQHGGLPLTIGYVAAVTAIDRVISHLQNGPPGASSTPVTNPAGPKIKP